MESIAERLNQLIDTILAERAKATGNARDAIQRIAEAAEAIRQDELADSGETYEPESCPGHVCAICGYGQTRDEPF